LVQKPLPPHKLWPLKGDKKEPDVIVWGDTPEEAKKMWEKIKKAHNLK